MNPDKQRIAIAEACGWRRISGVADEYSNFAWYAPDGAVSKQSDIPYFPFDLNAMHEAEMACIVGDEDREIDYFNELDKATGYDHYLTHFATAAQRAEAFLRTIGRWEDA